MAARYTKSIPDSVYFYSVGNGWWAGPFVKPQRGRECVEYRLERVNKPITSGNFSPETNTAIIALNIKGEKLKKKIAEMEGKRPMLTQEELDRLTKWLQSDEGRRKIRESQDKADAVCRIIDSMNEIDPKILTEPFNI